MSLEIKRLGEWVPAYPPKLTENGKIHRDNAERSAQSLLQELDSLGLRLTEQHKVTVKDFPLVTTPGKHNIVPAWIVEIPYVILSPLDFDNFDNKELILDSAPEWIYNRFYSIDANMDYGIQPLSMYMEVEPEDYEPYKLILAMPTHIPQEREISLDMLPLDFRSVGFRYDFRRNPMHRERISEFYEGRVDMDMVSGGRSEKSRIFGSKTPNGIDAISTLFLQTPNPSSHLKCYEVELFGTKVGQGRERFLDNTEEIVPESHWQEDEAHYCMTGDKETLTYPLFPIEELGRISTLSMVIHYNGKNDDPKRIYRLLQGFPLSIDGTNQWYATGYLEGGRVELLVKPEWGEDNARLVYRQQSKKRILPEEIHAAVVGMSALKTAITEGLAA